MSTSPFHAIDSLASTVVECGPPTLALGANVPSPDQEPQEVEPLDMSSTPVRDLQGNTTFVGAVGTPAADGDFRPQGVLVTSNSEDTMDENRKAMLLGGHGLVTSERRRLRHPSERRDTQPYDRPRRLEVMPPVTDEEPTEPPAPPAEPPKTSPLGK